MAIFVPLGIPAFDGTEEKGKIRFTQTIRNGDADKALIQIRNGAEAFYEKEITDPNLLTEGEHVHYWDGFNEDGILDTAFLTNAKNLNFLSKVWKNGESSFKTTHFKITYEEVNWVDVKIDKIASRINVTLRVNLKDGGANGVKCKEEVKKDYLNPGMKTTKTVCPWEQIPKEALSYYKKPIIKSRTIKFEELKEMVLDGINTYWSRRYTNTEGTIINDKNWEIIVTAINTENSSISLNDIPLIYNTNNPWSRSGNTGGSYSDGNLDDEAMELLPNGLVQRIAYNSGYIYHSNWKEWYKSHPIHKTKGWVFNLESKEKEDFKETAAHEIGHELLQAYYGTVYSWQHKGTSYYFPQDKKPINESFSDKITHLDFMESNGENTPKSGEIDLMKYYNDYSDYKERIVANEKDVKGLLWLTKLSLK